ncbi:MAG: PKD domain-containing protein [Arcticibacter sp.]
MKAHLNKLILLLLLATGFTSCQVEDPELGPAPTEEQVKFSATPSSDNANIITFKNESGPVNRAVWDLGNGQTGAGDQITGTFPLSGDYVVTLTIYTSGGSASKTQTLKIAQTKPEMLDRPDYNFLTGGGSNIAGKTWVIEKDFPGHLGVGPASSSTPEWYTAGPNEKKDLGFYDDEMTFTLSNNLAYTYVNNGTTFANGANAAGLDGGGAGDDRTVAYTPPANMKWSISEEGGKQYLSISGGGFIAYYTGMSKYEILKLNETELYLKAADKANPANAWYLRLAPKGYTRPVVEKPLKTANLMDRFDATGTIPWRADAIVFKNNFDNPFPQGLYTVAKVGYYQRLPGEANQYGNLQTTLDYRLDLSSRNKFKMMVFFPGGNEYPAVKQQVAVKLQNSLAGGNAWQTQKEVIQQVPELNKWVELTFDFSSISSVTMYDQIVIQPGGEGHQTPGIFYLGLFELQ